MKVKITEKEKADMKKIINWIRNSEPLDEKGFKKYINYLTKSK